MSEPATDGARTAGQMEKPPVLDLPDETPLTGDLWAQTTDGNTVRWENTVDRYRVTVTRRAADYYRVSLWFPNADRAPDDDVVWREGPAEVLNSPATAGVVADHYASERYAYGQPEHAT